MKKMLLWILGICLGLYLILCGFFYLYQERLIFYPTKLPPAYTFRFNQPFEEHVIPAEDGTRLHGLLFKAPSSRGLVFYLHGNAGALDTWGEIAPIYTSLNYDFFAMDYRGFGKSEGKLRNEAQFFSDVQNVYTHIKQGYEESRIIVIGFSVGTGSAAMLASGNSPGHLILQAPYYSLLDLMQNISPVIYALLPPFLFKYPFRTYGFVQNTRCPISIFHGDKDYVIYYGSSGKLQPHLKPTDQVIYLPGQGHNGINENSQYIRALQQLL